MKTLFRMLDEIQEATGVQNLSISVEIPSSPVSRAQTRILSFRWNNPRTDKRLRLSKEISVEFLDSFLGDIDMLVKIFSEEIKGI